MIHDDVQSLLGAYALDALDPEEVAAVEEHLAGCPRCQSEVAAYRNTASLLATPGGQAPAGVWDRIAAELAMDDPATAEHLPDLPRMARPEVRPSRTVAPSDIASPSETASVSDTASPSNVAAPSDTAGPSNVAPPSNVASPSNVVPLRRRRRVALPGVAALATAAAVAAVVLGVSASNLNHRVNDLSSALHAGGLRQAAAAAVLSGQHQNVQLASATGHESAQVVILPNGNAYLVRSDLPALNSLRTYQLWGLANGKVVSLGLLGSDPQVVAFRVEPGVSRLMVTAEPSGGVPAPTTPVLVQGNVLA